MVALICAFAALAAMLLCAVRVFAGPSLADSGIAATAAAACIAVCGASLAVLLGQSPLLDFALAAVLIAVLLACLWLKVFAFGSLQPPLADTGGAIESGVKR